MISRSDERHIERALMIAKASTCKFRHGVVIAHGKKVIAVGVNTERNHTLICSDPRTEASRHAEFNAARLVRYMDTSKMTLYSARVMRNGSAGVSKPCANCKTLIDLLDFKEVWYFDGHFWRSY